jgi:two-component SAPR family response regulator
MKINIIVVDDDRVITDKLKQIIAEWPEYYQHTIRIRTENSLRNINVATVIPYDLVILDVLIGEDNDASLKPKGLYMQ